MKSFGSSRNSMLKGLALLLVTSAITLNANAGRVLVIMKSQSSFDQVQSSYQRLGHQNLKQATQRWGFAPHALAQVDGSIQSTLENIHSVVLQVNDDAELQKLQLNPDVEMVEREIIFPAPAPIRGFNDMSTFANNSEKQVSAAFAGNPGFKATDKTPWGITAVKAPEAWALSHSGAGARVLVLDTGIDKDHPSLKDNFEKGQSFIDANSFAADPNMAPYSVASLPYPYFDDVGHGSHCSGTIAGALNANGFTGVAPKAKLLMGKVCAPQGCSNISIAAGINWGLSEKVDVISMSLGGAQSTPVERRAIDMALKAGIVVVAASGNGAGDPGYVPGTVSYPAALPGVIAVGAVDVNLKRATFSQYGVELAVVGPGVDVISSVPQGSGRESSVKIQVGNQAIQPIPSTFAQGARAIFQPLTADVVEAGFGKPEELAKVDAAGKIVLVQRGGDVKFAEKLQNALAAHAVGIIVYNNAPGLLHGAITQDGSELPLPLFIIEQVQGEAMKKSIAAKTKVSATLVVEKTDYSSFDGTSMATPHVAGVVALIKAANKSLTPAQVKQILQQTAQVLSETANNATGAGLVQADKAVAKAVK